MDDSYKVGLSQTISAWWRQNLAQRGFGATLQRIVVELWGFLRDSTPEQRRRRYGDVEFDWDHRVDTTSATVGWRERLLGVFHSPYQPTDPALFHEMLGGLKIKFSDFTFIDLGSGKGRTLLMASDYPFRRIVGVELLPELNNVARENLRKRKAEVLRAGINLRRCAGIRVPCGGDSALSFQSAAGSGARASDRQAGAVAGGASAQGYRALSQSAARRDTGEECVSDAHWGHAPVRRV
jgi:hypothetical protein